MSRRKKAAVVQPHATMADFRAAHERELDKQARSPMSVDEASVKVRAIAERLVEGNPDYQDPVWDRYRELREVVDRMRA